MKAVEEAAEALAPLAEISQKFGCEPEVSFFTTEEDSKLMPHIAIQLPKSISESNSGQESN